VVARSCCTAPVRTATHRRRRPTTGPLACRLGAARARSTHGVPMRLRGGVTATGGMSGTRWKRTRKCQCGWTLTPARLLAQPPALLALLPAPAPAPAVPLPTALCQRQLSLAALLCQKRHPPHQVQNQGTATAAAATTTTTTTTTATAAATAMAHKGAPAHDGAAGDSLAAPRTCRCGAAAPAPASSPGGCWRPWAGTPSPGAAACWTWPAARARSAWRSASSACGRRSWTRARERARGSWRGGSGNSCARPAAPSPASMYGLRVRRFGRFRLGVCGPPARARCAAALLHCCALCCTAALLRCCTVLRRCGVLVSCRV
jgi:hypothetical protein